LFSLHLPPSIPTEHLPSFHGGGDLRAVVVADQQEGIRLGGIPQRLGRGTASSMPGAAAPGHGDLPARCGSAEPRQPPRREGGDGPRRASPRGEQRPAVAQQKSYHKIFYISFFSCKIFHILFWQCFLTILSHNVFSKTFPFLFSSFYIN
jgi:hypothetical protein